MTACKQNVADCQLGKSHCLPLMTCQLPCLPNIHQSDIVPSQGIFQEFQRFKLLATQPLTCSQSSKKLPQYHAITVPNWRYSSRIQKVGRLLVGLIVMPSVCDNRKPLHQHDAERTSVTTAHNGTFPRPQCSCQTLLGMWAVIVGENRVPTKSHGPEDVIRDVMLRRDGPAFVQEGNLLDLSVMWPDETKENLIEWHVGKGVVKCATERRDAMICVCDCLPSLPAFMQDIGCCHICLSLWQHSNVPAAALCVAWFPQAGNNSKQSDISMRLHQDKQVARPQKKNMHWHAHMISHACNSWIHTHGHLLFHTNRHKKKTCNDTLIKKMNDT